MLADEAELNHNPLETLMQLARLGARACSTGVPVPASCRLSTGPSRPHKVHAGMLTDSRSRPPQQSHVTAQDSSENHKISCRNLQQNTLENSQTCCRTCAPGIVQEAYVASHGPPWAPMGMAKHPVHTGGDAWISAPVVSPGHSSSSAWTPKRATAGLTRAAGWHGRGARQLHTAVNAARGAVDLKPP